MHRCLQLAKNGLGTTYPNPLVGSVIVDEHNQIIGEGWHLESGKPHAEVNAIARARQNGCDDFTFAKATLYVNLEPCSHTGKTPPCADLLVNTGFKKVVIGTLDPHEKVAGRGVKRLQDAGIEVIVGVLEKECNQLNKRFFTFHKKQRPYIILKWGETSDGFIAPEVKDVKKPYWITNTWSRQRVHQLRAQEQAILVGAKTVIEDDPALTTRDWHGKSPQRFIWSDGTVLSNHYKLVADTETITIISDQVTDVVHQLYNHGIQSVIIEGGKHTLQSFIDAGLWDEAHQFMGTDVLLKTGLKAPELNGVYELTHREMIKNDVLKIYRKS